MKKIIILAVVLITMSLGQADAQIESCGTGHAIWSSDSTKIVNCISKEAWDNSQAEAMQRRADELVGNMKSILQGKTFWDSRGFENGCEWWYPMACVVKPEWFSFWL